MIYFTEQMKPGRVAHPQVCGGWNFAHGSPLGTAQRRDIEPPPCRQTTYKDRNYRVGCDESWVAGKGWNLGCQSPVLQTGDCF